MWSQCLTFLLAAVMFVASVAVALFLFSVVNHVEMARAREARGYLG